MAATAEEMRLTGYSRPASEVIPVQEEKLSDYALPAARLSIAAPKADKFLDETIEQNRLRRSMGGMGTGSYGPDMDYLSSPPLRDRWEGRESDNVVDERDSGRVSQFASLFPLTFNQGAVREDKQPFYQPLVEAGVVNRPFYPEATGREAGQFMTNMATDIMNSVKRLKDGIPEVKDFSPQDVMNVTGVMMTGGIPSAMARKGTSLGTFGGTVGATNLYGDDAVRSIMGRIEAYQKQGFTDTQIGSLMTERLGKEGLGLGQVVKREDGLWRFEIDDSAMKFNDDYFDKVRRGSTGNAKTTVGELIDHPTLFKAYPELQDVPLSLNVRSSFDGGGFGNMDGGPYINVYGSNPRQIQKTLTHEIQHYIQQVEGFSPGTNPNMGWIQDWVSRNSDMWQRKVDTLEDKGWISIAPSLDEVKSGSASAMYKRTLGEQEAELAARRMSMSPEDRRMIRANADNPVVINPDVTQSLERAQMSIGRARTNPEDFPRQAPLPLDPGPAKIRVQDTMIERARKGIDPSAPMPQGVDPSIIVPYRNLPKQEVAKIEQLLDKKATTLEAQIKKELPDLSVELEKSGSSRYLLVTDEQNKLLGKFRVGDHAATSPDSISIDPVSGNTVDTVLQVLKYEKGMLDKPPQVGWSFLPANPFRKAVNREAGMELFPEGRQIGGMAEYLKGGYAQNEQPYKAVSQTIGTDIPWRLPD